MPFEPVTCANGENPSSRISSPVWRAARRTAEKSPSGGGSRSITSRSGCQTRSSRESHTCGVIVFWPTRYTSVSALQITTWVTVPFAFGTSTRRIQLGK
jgi:hypothetical protein